MKRNETAMKRSPSLPIDLPADTEARRAMLNEMQERAEEPAKPAKRRQPGKRSATRSPGEGVSKNVAPIEAQKRLTDADLDALLESRAEHRVSIYMPLHAPGVDGPQNPKRLKNLLRQAEDVLVEKGVRAAEARDLLSRPAALVTDATFWQQGAGGLAILLTEESAYCYHLPEPVEESVAVDRRFRLRPLLPLLMPDARFWLLSVSGNEVKLFQGDDKHLEPVHVEDLPKDQGDALNLDVTKEGGQVHSAMSHSQTAAVLGKQGAVFHGQGDKSDERKEDLKLYCRAIDEALYDTLRADPFPLLVACVEYVFPIYAETNSYPGLIEQPLLGNFEHVSASQLHFQAWPLIEPLLHQERRDAAQRYERYVGAGKTSTDLAEILPAAAEGRIDALFVDRAAQQRGVFDAENRTVSLEDSVSNESAADRNTEDLIERAVAETLANSGAVYEVSAGEMPGGGEVAAVFRY